MVDPTTRSARFSHRSPYSGRRQSIPSSMSPPPLERTRERSEWSPVRGCSRVRG
jgi:hypothetical protein